MSLLIYKMFNNINMNFFNVQFLILIAIIVVIYFLYKEINLLHKKINKLQESIETKSNKPTETKNIQIVNEPLQFITSSESSDHIAIYSNDNTSSITINNKSVEVINVKPIEVNVQPVEVIAPPVEVIPTKVNVELKEELSNTTSDIELEEPDKIDINLESMNTDTIHQITNIINQEDELCIIDSDPQPKQEPIQEQVNNEEINLNNLEKMTLTNIKKIAEKYNITQSKKINGIQKQKTKKELIDNILNKI